MLRLQNLLMVSCLLMMVGCSKQDVAVEVPSIDIGVETVAFNPNDAPTVEFDVPGMHCKIMCVPKVRKTLEEQPGVVDVQVDLETKVAVVAIDEALFDANGALEALLAADFEDSALRSLASEEAVTDKPAPPSEDDSVPDAAADMASEES